MFPLSLKNLIKNLSQLPSIGPRAASRIALYLLTRPKEDLEGLGEAVKNLKNSLKICENCFNVSEGRICSICSDKKRDQGIICVVETPLELEAIEKTKQFSGLYHILGGVINPLKEIGPNNLKIKELLERLKKDRIKEVIIATNPNTEGDTTALYLKRIIEPYKIKATRIARGLPMGGDIEYADETTLASSLLNRH